jgi:TRAP-type C4-dicarboxylate transport system permease small subunit
VDAAPALAPGELPPDAPSAARSLKRLNDALGVLEVGLLGLWLAILIGVSAYFAIASKVLGKQETWPYEVIRFMVFFVAMTGAALAAQRQGMFNMDLVTKRFSALGRAYLRIASGVVVAGLCGLVVRAGFDLRANAATIEKGSEFISEPTAMIALIGGFALIGLHVLLHAGVDLVFLVHGRLPPDPPHGGHG